MYKVLGLLGIWKPAIIEAADDSGKTPLMCAVSGESASVTKLLLDKGADLEAKSHNGGTALSINAGGSRPVIRLLLERGADVEVRNNRGESPLIKASRFPTADGVQLLLQYGADVDGQDWGCGNTALMRAIEEDRSETVKVLVEHGANLELTNNKGHTAFLIACELGLLDIARLLLDKGVDVESQDPDGTSALSRACDGGYDSVVELQLKHDADVKSQNAVGATPLTCAAAAWDGG